MKKCKLCESEFTPNRCTQIYCCRACYIKGSNKERAEIKAIWAKDNKDRVRKAQRKWLEKYPDRRKAASSAYMKRNKAYYNQYSSLYRRAVEKATPLWVDKQELLDAYLEAEYQQLEVDHIIPIKNKLVCGLHIPENLQLLTRSENARKSNKFVPFDEDVQCIVEEESDE